MIKALFFDLDGTLLNTGKRIPSSAKDAIRACRQKGIRVFFASARSPRLDQTLDWTEDEFSLFDGGIYCNGACIQLGSEISYAYIDSSVVRESLALAEQYEDVHLSLHMPQEGYAFNFDFNPSMNKVWGLHTARILPIADEAMNTSIKILLFYCHLTDTFKPLPAQLADQLRQRCGSFANIYVTDAGRSIQITASTASKLAAIESVRGRLGLLPEEIAVFGDDVNDMEMISAYPHSVAMCNAVPAIRSAARYLTHPNDNDGVSYALREILHLCE